MTDSSSRRPAGEGRILHAQSQRMAAPVFALLLASCAGLLLFAALAEDALRWALLAAGGVMLWVALEFDRVTIIVTDRDLLAGFRLFRSRTPIDEIEGAGPEEIRFWRHGIGVHVGLGGAMMFTARTGPGVRVRRRGRLCSNLILSCHDPRALLDALGRAGAAGVTHGSLERIA